MNHLRSLAGPGLALAAVAALALVVLVASPGRSSQAADHLDAPTTKTDGRTDINDVYVFHPVDEGGDQLLDRTVLAMTVNPAAGVISGTEFNGNARYDFAIDTDGDAIEDLVYRSSVKNKIARVQRIEREGGTSTTGAKWGPARQIVIAKQDKTDGGMGLGAYSGEVKLHAGLRDDPFFFDLNGFNAGAAFCSPGSDFFLGLNVSAIVIELPTEDIGSGPVGVWARTLLKGTPESEEVVPPKVQFDRMGRPAINTVFIPSNPFEPTEASMEDAFNAGEPRNDQAAFRAEVVDSLALLYSLNDGSGDDPSDDAAAVAGLADVLLPDVLTVDLSAATGFLNGRGLADDVIDAELGLITEGLLTTDCVDNDSAFLAGFPYLAEKN